MEERILVYQSNRTSLNYYDQANQLKTVKQLEGYEWIAEVQSQVLQDVLRRLDKTYQSFFRGKGFPKFARRGQYRSFTFPQINTLKLVGNRIILPKLGSIRYFNSRRIEGKVKTITVSKEVDGWYMCLSCEVAPKVFQGENQAIGIDLGVARLATLSNGIYFENPMFLKKYQRQLGLLQRQLSRQKKGSNCRVKTKHRIAKLHQKIRRCRTDYLHKVSTTITSKYNEIYMEDLNLSGMTKSAKGTVEEPGTNIRQKSGLNRSLLDSSLGQLTDLIAYKILHQSGLFLKINPAYTSQKCSACSSVSKDNRKSQSVFQCKDCSFAIHADVNGAINILGKGIAASRQRGALARA